MGDSYVSFFSLCDELSPFSDHSLPFLSNIAFLCPSPLCSFFPPHSYGSSLFGPSPSDPRQRSAQNAFVSSSGSGLGAGAGAVSGSSGAYSHLAHDPQRQRRAVQERHDRLYEEANDELIDELNDKVGVLRQLTIEIGKESKSSYLDDVDDAFTTAGGAMTQTLKKVTKLLESGGGSYMCYLVLFIFALFMGMYFLIKRK